MANKRQLKKHIRYVCGDLAAEIMIASHALKGFDRDEVSRIVGRIASLQVSSLRHCSFNFDKASRDFESPAAYRRERSAYNRKAFARLRSEFRENVLSIVKDMNAAMPAEVREANKD